MEIKWPSSSKTVNWNFLPDKFTILQYLTRNDMIELSKCCKCYRKQLEREIFNNLSLTSWLYSNEKIREEMRISGVYDKLLRILQDDMGDKLKLVKKFIFISIFRLDLASEVFNLLPNVDSIEFSHSYAGSFEDQSISFINDRNNLEHIKFIEYRRNHSTFRYTDTVFPNSLKSLRVQDHPHSNSVLPYFDNIDFSYTNLTALDIPDKHMLKKLTSTMPNLKEVGILDLRGANESLTIEFIKINPQLKKLTLYRGVFEKLVQTALSLKSLTYLAMFRESYNLGKNIVYPDNYSIKTLTFDCEYSGAKAIKIINACKNIEILDLRKWITIDFKYSKWSKLKQSIKTLYFSYDSEYFIGYSTYNYIIKSLDKLQLFEKIIISLKHFFKKTKNFHFYKLKNYKVAFSVSGDPKTITMVKIKQ